MRLHDGGWYVDDGAQHASLVEKTVDISLLSALNPEDPHLLEADLWAMGASDDYKLMKEAYQCEVQFLTGIEQTCDFRLRMVIHRNRGSGGKVKFVKPTSDGPMDEKCQAYSQCLANRVYLGEDAPMPSTGEELVAVHMDHRMLPFKGDVGEFKTTTASQLAGLRLEYHQMQENPDSDPRSLARMEALLKFMELRSGDPP
ncbi:MAG: hypothetical protein H0T76_27375 [Nannocystis sp.]|nr:hypothetical protein [Nannocystis sp.]MBA3550213.1 hypothetical protein [Nannocystis sp.]